MHEVCGLAVRAVWVGRAQCVRVAQQPGHVSVGQCMVHAVQCAVVGQVSSQADAVAIEHILRVCDICCAVD